MRKQVFTTAIGALALLAAGAASAQGSGDPQAQLQVRSLAATCANCHGTDGRTVPGSSVPPLAGMPADYLSEQMRAFKSGQRPATVMHQLAKGYNDQQIAQIAAYFAAQKK
ncbi:c-type cytochrome [Caldimonas brevitalea]|uniref:Cytochrome C553 n=1 Tax=Caldimonas brevitalea TaxID=413882 RepID=A0A0G3BKG1_9BURK|nr:cytochrome c [Caldimonas brevitalea]AKJ27035.1 cytochrome C553 [Caldimonas brevitalea]